MELARACELKLIENVSNYKIQSNQMHNIKLMSLKREKQKVIDFKDFATTWDAAAAVYFYCTNWIIDILLFFCSNCRTVHFYCKWMPPHHLPTCPMATFVCIIFWNLTMMVFHTNNYQTMQNLAILIAKWKVSFYSRTRTTNGHAIM